jgi:hypothetical protein
VDALGGQAGNPSFAPTNGIWANLPAAQQAHINGGAQNRQICPADAIAILYGTILEMSFLTNNVPLGLCADFSQSAGGYSFANSQFPGAGVIVPGGRDSQGYLSGDPLNGIPAAAFRRKLEVPILLQHGENMGMRLNIPRNIEVEPTTVVAPANRALGTGWFELRVDWWAHESFTEKS